MTYAFVHDVPASPEIYDQITKLLGPDLPTGLVSHIAMKREHGLRYVDVWETQADWETFRDERLHPAVGQVLASYGLPHDESVTSMEVIEVIDAWVSAAALR